MRYGPLRLPGLPRWLYRCPPVQELWWREMEVQRNAHLHAVPWVSRGAYYSCGLCRILYSSFMLTIRFMFLLLLGISITDPHVLTFSTSHRLHIYLFFLSMQIIVNSL